MLEFHTDYKRYFDIQLENARRSVIPFIEQGKPLKPGMQLLEIGCGQGSLLRAFAEKGLQCVGVEMYPLWLEKANEWLQPELQSGQVRLISSNIYDVNPEQDLGTLFDVIVLSASTVTGAAGVPVSASAATTLSAATVASAGSVAVLGTVTPTLAAATASGSGAIVVRGTAAVTLGAATASASGAIVVFGTAAVALGAATASGSGSTSNAAPTDPTVRRLTWRSPADRAALVAGASGREWRARHGRYTWELDE